MAAPFAMISKIFYQKNSPKSNIFCEVFARCGNNIVYITFGGGAVEENKRGGAWLRSILWVAGGVIIALAVRGRVGGIILPLALAYVGARAVRPLSRMLCKASRANEKAVGALLAVVLCGVGVYAVSAVSVKLGEELWSLVDELPRFVDSVLELVQRISASIPWKKTDGG